MRVVANLTQFGIEQQYMLHNLILRLSLASVYFCLIPQSADTVFPATCSFAQAICSCLSGSSNSTSFLMRRKMKGEVADGG
jgi:hypothetical protein